MKSNYLSIGIILLLGFFASCEKENLDLTTTNEEEAPTEVTVCDLEITIAEQPPGSGDLYTAVSGGTAPYSYEWSNGATTASISVTAEGTYSVTVTDANDCADENNIIIAITDPCEAFAVLIAEQPPGSGDLYTTVSGGTTPYSYEWSDGAITASTSATTDGTYFVTVTDADGCITEDEIMVTITDPCESFNLGIAEQPPGSGNLYTAVNGGTAPYVYSWSTGENTSSIFVTVGGTYSVIVSDANGCTLQEQITVEGMNNCASFSVLIAEQPPGSGDLYLAPSGGTAPYTYVWSTGETTASITVTAGDTYSVTATDSTGCVTEDDIQL